MKTKYIPPPVDFSLRERCNGIIKDLNKAEGTSNIIRISIDIEVPDRLQDNPYGFEERLKMIIGWLSNNIVNGVLTIDLACKINGGNNLTLDVIVSGRDSDGGIQNLDPDSNFFDIKLQDKLIHSIRKLSVPENHNLQCTIRKNAILVTYHESFFYSPNTTDEGTEIFKDKCILLVEDNEINAMVFVSFMEDWGVITTIAKNGMEAVAISRERRFDLILMDIHMPVMNGIVATRMIRTFLPSIAIVALTASSLEDDIRDAYQAGVSGYLHKPVTSAQLFRAISEHLH